MPCWHSSKREPQRRQSQHRCLSHGVIKRCHLRLKAVQDLSVVQNVRSTWWPLFALLRGPPVHLACRLLMAAARFQCGMRRLSTYRRSHNLVPTACCQLQAGARKRRRDSSARPGKQAAAQGPNAIARIRSNAPPHREEAADTDHVDHSEQVKATGRSMQIDDNVPAWPAACGVCAPALPQHLLDAEARGEEGAAEEAYQSHFKVHRFEAPAAPAAAQLAQVRGTAEHHAG